MKEIATEHQISASATHRALDLLKKWGLVEASRGRRAVIIARPEETPPSPSAVAAEGADQASERELLDLEVIQLGKTVRKVRAEADPASASDLRQLLLDAVRRNGGQPSEIGEYEMNVHYAGERGLITTFVATR